MTFIALMGIDGAGKSTLTNALREHLTARGHEVSGVTLDSYLSTPDTTGAYPRTSVERLGLEGWRLFYAGCQLDGRSVDELVPLLFEDFGSSGLAKKISQATGSAHQSGVITSALVELAGQVLLRATVAEPVLRRGGIALSDGFGVKNVIKTLRLAQRMTEHEVPRAALDGFIEHSKGIFGQPWMQPGIGLLLDADPAVTYQWRMDQHGHLGAGEDLTLAGTSGRDTYVEFQTALAQEYREVATAWGWHVLKIDGRPQESTIAEAIAVIDEQLERA